MEEFKFPIVQINNDKMKVVVDLNIYNKEVITTTLYKFSNLFYIHQSLDEKNPSLVNVIFESKENQIPDSQIVKQFCNELIDQQLRYYTNKQFGHIRDLIVEEAFKPVNNK